MRSFPVYADHSFIFFIFHCHSLADEPSGRAPSKSLRDLQINRGEIPLLSKFPSESRAKQCRETHAPRTPVLCTDGHIQLFFVWYPPQNRLRKLSNLKQFVFEITFTNYLTKIFFLSMAKIITALQPTIIIIQSWGKIFTCSVAQTDNCDYCTRLWDLRLKLRCSLHRHAIYYGWQISYRLFYIKKRGNKVLTLIFFATPTKKIIKKKWPKLRQDHNE